MSGRSRYVQTDKKARTFTVTLEGDMIEPFYNFVQSEGCASPQDAARMMFRMALAAVPQDAASLATRVRAFNETRNWAVGRLMGAINEIAVEMRASLPTSETERAPSPVMVDPYKHKRL